jgi:GNAT superfamily N-acetyltransferase
MIETSRRIACAPMLLSQFEATTEYLARDPITHTLLIALARRAQSATAIRRQFVLAHDDEQQIVGVMFGGEQTILAASAPTYARALAHARSSTRNIRALIGPEAIVDAFLDGYRKGLLQSVHRDMHQELYVLGNLTLDPAFFAQHVYEADSRNLNTVAAGAAAMIDEELGYDPSRRPSFGQEILQQIHARRWWIAQDDALRLLCRVGASTIESMQLECIWAPIESRGMGYATRALATICAQLLKRRPTLSLAVNRDNERAKRLYERLGFVRHGTQRTVLWMPDKELK